MEQHEERREHDEQQPDEHIIIERGQSRVLYNQCDASHKTLEIWILISQKQRPTFQSHDHDEDEKEQPIVTIIHEETEVQHEEMDDLFLWQQKNL